MWSSSVYVTPEGDHVEVTSNTFGHQAFQEEHPDYWGPFPLGSVPHLSSLVGDRGNPTVSHQDPTTEEH